MVFVGRGRETAHIANQLSRGNNIVVTGNFGVGRTALVRHVATVLGEQWRFLFLDFAQTPGRLCSEIVAALDAPRGRLQSRATLSYRSARARITNLRLASGPRLVLVMDNLEAVTRARLSLLRRLSWTRHFQSVVIVDEAVGPAGLLAVRENLYPVCLLRVRRLPRPAACAFFDEVARELGVSWGAGEIAGLAAATGGYPLMMVEAAARARRRLEAENGTLAHLPGGTISSVPPDARTHWGERER
jgi:nucleoside-triphosphatase THEP1